MNVCFWGGSGLELEAPPLPSLTRNGHGSPFAGTGGFLAQQNRMSTAVTATPAIDTAIDRAFTDNRLVGAVVLIARDGRLFIAGQEELASPSLRKTISSRKGLCSLPLLTNWNPTLWWRSYYAVEDPDRMARAAQDAGSGITRARELDPFTVVSDPFGGYWALIKGTSSLTPWTA